ncbi:MAG: hypothetical protein LQ338_004391 [Usnochroma carphineum]|nr:MAG: hypothetical protein LQ338_004391 [Usnochroma carphineum]
MATRCILPLLLLSPLLCHAIPPGGTTALWATSPGNLQNDDNPCPDYKTCSSTGHRLWNMLQRTIAQPHPVDRIDGKPLFDTWYATDTIPLANHGAEIRPDLLAHGLDYTKMTVWATMSKDPETGEESIDAAYGNIIDPAQGVVVAIENTRDFDEVGKLHWSEIVYQTWSRAKPAPGDNLSTLRYSIQNKVDNPPAQAIIQLAYAEMGYPPVKSEDAQWRRWTLAETPNWFYALLGTDNCKGTIWLLNDHAAEAGKKVVTEVWTRWPGVYPDIWCVSLRFLDVILFSLADLGAKNVCGGDEKSFADLFWIIQDEYWTGLVIQCSYSISR